MLSVCSACGSAQDLETSEVCWFCGKERRDPERDHSRDRPTDLIPAESTKG